MRKLEPKKGEKGQQWTTKLQDPGRSDPLRLVPQAEDVVGPVGVEFAGGHGDFAGLCYPGAPRAKLGVALGGGGELLALSQQAVVYEAVPAC